jgi:hypothetical protein
VPYPIETDAPLPWVKSVVGGKELYALGKGLVKLVGNAWQPVAGAPDGTFDAWEAPDGTLFVAAPAGTNANLWRFDGNSWTLDKAVGIDIPPSGRLRGRSSSDVLYVHGSGILRWNGSTWSSMAPPPIIGQLYDAAYAGTSWIVAQTGWHDGSGDHLNLLEYDGSTWTDLGPTNLSCCAQVGPLASPRVFMGFGNYAVRDQNGWSMLKTTFPPDTFQTLGYPAGGGIAGYAPDKLFTRTRVGAGGWGLGTLDANNTWVVDTGWHLGDFELYSGRSRGMLWADDHIVAMPVQFGGRAEGLFYIDGEAVTVCDVGP